jgi:rod shape-determining protein MreC
MAYTREDVEKQERRQVYTAIGFFVLSLVLLNLPGAAQQQIATVLRSTVLRPFVTMQRAVNRTRVRAVETTILRARFDSLTVQLVNNATLAEENDRLRGLLDLGGRLGRSFTAASVLRSGTPGSESVFMLDLGARDRVHANAPVLVREGLVGKVIEVRDRESIGMDWSHPDFRASAMTRDGDAYGLVEPDRGIFRESDRLLLNGIPFFTELEPGTEIVTSGRGGVFPRGIPIGTVVELNQAEERWRRSYWIRPSARPGEALQVLVSTGPATAGSDDLTPAFSPEVADTVSGGDLRQDSIMPDSVAPGPAADSSQAPGSSQGVGVPEPPDTTSGAMEVPAAAPPVANSPGPDQRDSTRGRGARP